MGDLVLKGATSGQITVTPTAIAGTNTLTLPAKTGNIITSADSGTVTQAMIQNGNSGTPLPGIASTGPTFYAYPNAVQSVSNATPTKVVLQAERYDTNNNFDSSTNYRFTPTVAGYYYITGTIAVASLVNNTGALVILYRNGSSWALSTTLSSSVITPTATVSSLMYMNGSTDYVELYAYQNSGSSVNLNIATFANSDSTYFCGALVRAA